MQCSDIPKIFGKNIQRKRKALNLTQERLAELLGIGQQSLSRIERGAISPKFDRLSTFAHALHTSVSELFIEEGTTDSDTEAMLKDILQGLNKDERVCILKFVANAAMLFKNQRLS